MPKKNITIDDLAKQIQEGFETQEKHLIKKMDEKIDDLAGMTKRGFDEVYDEIHNEVGGLKKQMSKLEQGQEDIKLRLDNVAYRFELVELQRRVTLLEKKAIFSK